jgi:hypothetical protein
MSFLERIWPAIALVIVGPITAEYLLGSLSIAQLQALLFIGPMYGFGVLLVREIARQTGRGWPTIVALGFIYAVLEEGIGDQTLFNRDFYNMHLLDYGFIPALGMASPYTILVLSLHVIWSICAPIGLVELLFAQRRTEPWLGRIGLGVTGVLYLVGLAMLTVYFLGIFSAMPFQYGIVALMLAAGLAVTLYVSAPGKARATLPGTAPNLWLVGGLAFVGSSLFWLLFMYANPILHLPAEVTSLAMLIIIAGGLVYFFSAGRREGWSNMHRLALVAGTLCTYFWVGLFHFWWKETFILASQFGLIAVYIATIAFAAWKLKQAGCLRPDRHCREAGSSASAQRSTQGV